MRVLSVDPGYDRLGIAVIEKEKGQKETLVYSDCFLTDKKQPLPERYLAISEEIDRLVEKYKPEIFSSETLFFSKNQKTAIAVAGARGVLLCAAEKNKLPIYEYSPLEIKVAVTGYGKSDKDQVTDMVKRLIRIEKEDVLDDEYDAIAVGLTCLAMERF